MKDKLSTQLGQWDQEHLLHFWDELSPASQKTLAAQIEELDFELLSRLYRGKVDAPNWAELAAQAKPPRAIRLDERTPAAVKESRAVGEAALRDGKIGLILVAGGQGTRLGFPHPKGMFPLGPVSGRTLFQILVDRLLAVGRRYGKSIPLYLMTSPATHEETLGYFRSHQNLGIADADLHVFCQGVMPAVDAATGQVLLEAKDQIALSPDGHGGMLAAFHKRGCMKDATDRGLEHLFYIQVDNPLAQVADPELIGHHIQSGSEMTTQVVAKVDALEKVGNVVLLDNKLQIIEYSDLPQEIAERRNPNGSLLLWAGNIAIHVFSLEFLRQMAARADSLPFHRALKKTPFVDSQGVAQDPQEPNAIKFERFIFDLLPLAPHAIAVEAAKEEAFAPVKNPPGAASDSPELAQRAMVRQHTRWLEAAGAFVAPDTPVEIHPAWALEPEDVPARLQPNSRFDCPTYLQ